ncbi:hypothetical protein BJX68DRAFT_265937 [Aspergillus pseudodeflectus]|uniref:Actin-like ATPase domain-containing protein n=1 Tax=Aspergillus pseudodeflectus TaxID=176178 RepID=A0ABR4KHC6_9EURO
MGDSDRHRIIVGVDYGTTFTGASFVSTRAHDINDIVLIKSWPGPARHTEIVLKTPSRIAYAAENGGRERWGYQVEPGMVAHSWTKLLLDRGTPLTQFDDALEEAAGMGIFKQPPGKSAIQVVADYLSKVYNHILQAIAKQITEATLQITPLEFWFTVPAIWSDEAKHATLQAARLAGFGTRPGNVEDKINLITEPEAAAIAALRKTTTDGMGASVKAGDGVLVCDCGGGTVDITTYLIQAVHPKLEFEELCTGIGGKCGSTAVDRNFYMLMKARFGKAFSSLPRRRIGPGSEFMNKFEIVKRDFGMSTEDDSVHPLPLNMPLQKADPEYFDVDERFVLLSNDDLQGLFEPVVSKILNLVRQQVEYANEQAGRSAINRIILVGGFGDSDYLRNAFLRSFGNGGKIEVTTPDNAQAAIVQGAALRGLEGRFARSRRCRRYYGYTSGKTFREDVDDPHTAYFDRFYGDKRSSGHMTWLTRKGQQFPANYSKEMKVFRTHSVGESLVYTDTLYACDKETAPGRVEHQDVRKIGDITVDFRNVNLSMFKTKRVSGRLLYKLDYSLNVIFGAQEGVLMFEARANGQVIGKTSVDFARALFY